MEPSGADRPLAVPAHERKVEAMKKTLLALCRRRHTGRFRPWRCPLGPGTTRRRRWRRCGIDRWRHRRRRDRIAERLLRSRLLLRARSGLCCRARLRPLPTASGSASASGTATPGAFAASAFAIRSDAFSSREPVSLARNALPLFILIKSNQMSRKSDCFPGQLFRWPEKTAFSAMSLPTFTFG